MNGASGFSSSSEGEDLCCRQIYTTVIWQVSSPWMYRCIGKACTHAGRSSTRAGGPMHGFGGLRCMDSRQQVVPYSARREAMMIARRPENHRHGIAVHAQSAGVEGGGSLTLAAHMVQECATSCLYNDAAIRPVLFISGLALPPVYARVLCFFLPWPTLPVVCFLPLTHPW